MRAGDPCMDVAVAGDQNTGGLYCGDDVCALWAGPDGVELGENPDWMKAVHHDGHNGRNGKE